MKKILTTILLFCSLNAFSQIDDPADGDGTVPVDGGVSLLLAAGAAYGIRRVQSRRVRKVNKQTLMNESK
jgi:hypothetical protein